MLCQIHPDGNALIALFGTKRLTKQQSLFGPTKRELLGIVTTVLDCSSYLNEKHSTVDCDHQALTPLFEQLPGAIYERWFFFTMVKLFHRIQTRYVINALSSTSKFPTTLEECPDEDDPFSRM